jgi:glycerol kinase
MTDGNRKKPTLILSIDQGTTSSRAIIFDMQTSAPIATAQKELTLHTPHKGWVEQNPDDILNDTIHVCREAIKSADASAGDILAIGITNQRETTILWDRKTGKPLYNAIVWQDRRTAEYCQSVKKHETAFQEKTGLLLDPYFSFSKIRWILDNVEGAGEAAMRGDIAFGTVDCFLLWHLTGGAVHATDVTNAARTGLYNITTHMWDDNLLEMFGIPRAILPDVMDNAAEFGTTTEEILGAEIPVRGMAGDQQSALIGQACFAPGMIKSTYGTGCFALMNIGEDFKLSRNRLLTTPAYRIHGRTSYAIEGSIFMAGAILQWLRDNLGIIENARDSETIAQALPDNNGVYLVPAFTGMGAPHWKPEARAAIFGLTRDSTKHHIIRAALEAQAYQTYDLLTAMQADTGTRPDSMRIDGGLSMNNFVCGFLSDILSINIRRPHHVETTALGAAYLAALQSGLFGSTQDITEKWQCEKTFKPAMDENDRAEALSGWHDALKRVF